MLPLLFDWRILESTKELGDNLPVLHLPAACLPSHGPDSGPGYFSQASLELSHPPAAATRLPHQILESLFSGLSLSPARTTYSSGGVELDTTYIPRPTPVSLPATPCGPKSRILVANIKASEALDGLGCCTLRA